MTLRGKIVLDVSVVGLGQLFETARTGIYRVISNLSTELLQRDNQDIVFTSLSSLEVNRLTSQFFEDMGHGEKEISAVGLEKLILALSQHKLASNSRTLCARILSRLCRESRSRRIADQAALFHSMYGALPESIQRSSVAKMLSIYDIIPLLHPEYFADGFVEQFVPIVTSFSPKRDFVLTISEWSKADICEYFSMAPEQVFVAYPAASPSLYQRVSDKTRIDETKKSLGLPDVPYLLTLATVEKR